MRFFSYMAHAPLTQLLKVVFGLPHKLPQPYFTQALYLIIYEQLHYNFFNQFYSAWWGPGKIRQMLLLPWLWLLCINVWEVDAQGYITVITGLLWGTDHFPRCMHVCKLRS